MTESTTISNVSLQEAKRRALEHLESGFLKQDVKKYRWETDNPLIRVGSNKEIVIEKIGENRVEVEADGPGLVPELLFDSIKHGSSEASTQSEGGYGSTTTGPDGEDRGIVEDSRTGQVAAKEGRVFKPFGHEEANYMGPDDPNFDPSHKRCRDCAHFDNHGQCHIVPNIEGDGYCENFFADAGFFGHLHPDEIELNLAMYGESFDWDKEVAEEFIEALAETLEDRIGG